MTVSTGAILKEFYDQTKALGAKVISSDATLEIQGFETIYLLTKSFPWPTTAVGGEIEIATPLGALAYQPQQIKVAHQGPITFSETVAGSIDDTLRDLITQGGTFNAKVYEGTPGRFLRAKRIVDCFLVMDNPDRNWEDRSVVLTFSGTIFFHYFGEILPGNSKDYR